MNRKIDNTDYIAIMADDELNMKIRRIEYNLSKNNEDRYNSRDVASEIDLCYYQREAEVREIRRARHQEWLTNHS